MGETISLFLLTKTEKDLLAPIRLILADITIKYRSLDLTELSQETIDDMQNRDFADLCAQRDIDTAAALNLSAMLTNNKWFTVWPIRLNKGGDLTGNDPSNPPWIYTLVTSDNPDKLEDIPIKKNPAFYQLVCDDYKRPVDKKFFNINPEIFILQTQQVLNLSMKYKYIDPDSLVALSTIRYAFVDKLFPSTKKKRRLQNNITYNKTHSLATSTDKLMNIFFSMSAPSPKEINGQRQMVPLKYEGIKSKDTITLFYDYMFDEEELKRAGIKSKNFNSYDFFVATALDNLNEAGNTVISFSKLLEEMGFTGRPCQKQLTQLSESLIKGMTTTISIDNRQISEAWGNKTYLEIKDHVFPIRMKRELYLIGNLPVNGIIEIRDYTPFKLISEKIGHLTEWKKEILQLYSGRRTERYWSVLKYLIRNIGWMRNDRRRAPKITYSNLFKETGETTTRGKQLTKEMLCKLLDEVFIPAGYVKNYQKTDNKEPGILLTIQRNKTKNQLKE